jgi:cell division protein FtsZ
MELVDSKEADRKEEKWAPLFAEAKQVPIYGHQPYTPTPPAQAVPVANIVAAPLAPETHVMPHMPVSPSPEHRELPISTRPERIEIRPQAPAYNPEADLARKRAEMAERTQMRRDHFKNKNGAAPQPNLSQMEASPAYARRGYQLDEQQGQADPQSMSRFALTENQELVGQNKFLHDNVD